MANSIIPGLQYKSALTVEDFVFLEKVYSDEFITRWLSSVGNYRTVGASFGIVAELDPANATTSQLSLPLIASVNNTQSLTVDVQSGLAFTENGNWARLDLAQEEQALAGVDEGDINVIFLEYKTVLTETRVSLFSQTQVPAYRTRGTENDAILQVASLTDWNNPAKFTAARKKDIVVLAVSTIVDVNGTLTQSIDMSQNNFGFVRPWYSIIDIGHRSALGTGTVTSTNPHGTGINDLSAGNLTLYQQFLETGAIISKALDVPHVPGLLCKETIPAAAVLTDTTGLVTAKSRYGGINSQYAFLQFYPTSMSSCWETGRPQNSLSVDFVSGTTILVFAPREIIPSAGVTVNYFHVFALEAPSVITSNTITFSQPQAKRELIIANGVAFDEVDTPQANLEASGPIPVDFTVVIDGTEDFVILPQKLLGAIKLSALGNAVTTIDTPMYGEANIKIGLTRATPGPDMVVTVDVVGTDINGTVLPERLTFGSTWTDVTIPGVPTETQFVTSINVFKSITSIQIPKDGRSNDGINSTIIVYADIKPFGTTDVAETCPVVKATWDGAAVSKLEDIRLFIPSLSFSNRKNQMLEMGSANVMGTIALLNNIGHEVIDQFTKALNSKALVEDFNDPIFIDTLQIDAEPTTAVGALQIISNTDVTDGDSIQINPVASENGLLIAKDRVFGQSVGGLDATTNLPLTNLSSQSDEAFKVLVDGDIAGAQTVTLLDLTTLNTGVKIATEMEARIQALGVPSGGTVDYSNTQVDFDQQIYSFGTVGVYTIQSNTSGSTSSVVILPASVLDLSDDLLLGVASASEGATQTAGTDNDFANGEFDIGATGSDTRDNIISTINNVDFNSGIVGTAHATLTDAVTMESTATGAITNFTMRVTSEAVANNYAITGFDGGFDTHRAVNYNSFVSGINYPALELEDDSSVVRNKYRTRAVSLDAAQETKQLLILVHGATVLGTGSIKVRPTFTEAPTVWQPFITANEVANTTGVVFLAVSPQRISKFQLEITGKMEGVSVFSILQNVITEDEV